MAIISGSLADIRDVIKKLKLNTAPGEDSIQAEVSNADAQTAAEILHSHIAVAWENE